MKAHDGRVSEIKEYTFFEKIVLEMAKAFGMCFGAILVGGITYVIYLIIIFLFS